MIVRAASNFFHVHILRSLVSFNWIIQTCIRSYKLRILPTESTSKFAVSFILKGTGTTRLNRCILFYFKSLQSFKISSTFLLYISLLFHFILMLPLFFFFWYVSFIHLDVFLISFHSSNIWTAFYMGYSGLSTELTTLLHSVPRLIMSGTLPPRHYTPS